MSTYGNVQLATRANLSTKITDRDIIMAYQVLLRRTPENSSIIKEMKRRSPQELINEVITSREFRTEIIGYVNTGTTSRSGKFEGAPSKYQIDWLKTFIIFDDIGLALLYTAPSWAEFFTRLIRIYESERSKAVPAFVAHRPYEPKFFLIYDSLRRDPTEFSIVTDRVYVSVLSAATSHTAFGNQISNGDFSKAGRVYWGQLSIEEGYLPVKVNFNQKFSITSIGVGYIYLKADAPKATLIHSVQQGAESYLPVTTDRSYAFYGYFATHRCCACLMLVFRDAKGNALTHHTIEVESDIVGGTRIEDYKRVGIVAVAPPSAKTARLTIVVTRVYPDRDAFLFMTCLWFGRSLDQGMPQWCPSPTDIFDVPPGVLGDSCSLAAVEVGVPPGCLDGQEHNVQVFDRQTGIELIGSQFHIKHHLIVSGEISKVVGDLVIGYVVVSCSLINDLTIKLLIDEEIASKGTASGAGVVKSFSLAIPSHFCDGRPHVFSVAIDAATEVFACLPAWAPMTLTPFGELQAYVALPMGLLAKPVLRHRYRGLVDHLAKLAGAPGLHAKHLLNTLIVGPTRGQNYQPLLFPTVDRPTVSVIVVHKLFITTYQCLVALLFAVNDVSYEVIIAYDHPSDETVPLERMVSGIKVIHNGETSASVPLRILAADEAVGEFLVFLDSHVEVTSHWLDELIFVFENFAGVGLVGSKVLGLDGRLLNGGGVVWSDGDFRNYGCGENSNAPGSSYLRQVDFMTGGALMVPRTAWKDVGPFTHGGGCHDWEDLFLASELQKQGLKTVFAPMSIVYQGEMGALSIKNVATNNRSPVADQQRLVDLWGTSLQGQPNYETNIERAKDRLHYRVLLIDANTPQIDSSVDSYNMIQEIRIFQALGFKVTFAAADFLHLGHRTEDLQRVGVEVVYAPYIMSFDDLLRKRGQEFQLILVRRFRLVRQVFASVREYAPVAKLLANLTDLQRVWGDALPILQRLDQPFEQVQEPLSEKLEVLKSVDFTLTYSGSDKTDDITRGLDPAKVVSMVRIVEPQIRGPHFDLRRDIGYVCSVNNLYDVEAVEFFLKNVFASLVKKIPGLKFLLFATADLQYLRRKWSSDHVLLHESVDDFRQFLDTTRLVVAPLQSSDNGNIINKIVDCFAAGVPAVLSPAAAEGLVIQDKHEAMIAQSPQEWVDKIIQLYTREGAWTSMSRAAKLYIDCHHGLERGVEPVRLAVTTTGIPCQFDPSHLYSKGCRPITSTAVTGFEGAGR